MMNEKAIKDNLIKADLMDEDNKASKNEQFKSIVRETGADNLLSCEIKRNI